MWLLIQSSTKKGLLWPEIHGSLAYFWNPLEASKPWLEVLSNTLKVEVEFSCKNLYKQELQPEAKGSFQERKGRLSTVIRAQACCLKWCRGDKGESSVKATSDLPTWANLLIRAVLQLVAIQMKASPQTLCVSMTLESVITAQRMSELAAQVDRGCGNLCGTGWSSFPITSLFAYVRWPKSAEKGSEVEQGQSE